jgi:hypothetical protein
MNTGMQDAFNLAWKRYAYVATIPFAPQFSSSHPLITPSRELSSVRRDADTDTYGKAWFSLIDRELESCDGFGPLTPWCEVYDDAYPAAKADYYRCG